MKTTKTHTPRALMARPAIEISLTPSELAILIRALEARANAAAEHFDQVDYADFLFQRIADLREAGR